MADAERALEFLRANIGIGEHPAGSNCNWLTEWFGVGCVAWCSITMSRALIEAGFGTPDRLDVPGVSQDYAKGIAYVPSLRLRWMAAGLYDQSPRVGDLVVFTWGPGEPIGDHTGMVESVVGDGSVVTLEGNHNDDLVRMRRSMAVIDGFCHPPYAPEPAPTPAPTPPKEPDVSKIAYPLDIPSGERRRFPIPAIGGGFGWTKVAVTYSSGGVDVAHAIVGPNERPIPDLAPVAPATSRAFGGRGYVDLTAGDEWIDIELSTATLGTLDLTVEAADG